MRIVEPPRPSTRDRQATARRRRGFTAIELMAVVAIVAILATVAAPSFRQLIATQRVRGAASALAESLWVARAEALKRNTDVGFVFADISAGWEIPDPGGGAVPLLTQPAYTAVRSQTQSAGSVQFNFNAYGRLSTGSGWIQLGDDDTGVFRCVVVSTTGRATAVQGKCNGLP
ncbi:MAG TPA: GspH/FimT family pseudopilin [Burkholderiaceae bacterium]